jgi:hypothetical protein
MAFLPYDYYDTRTYSYVILFLLLLLMITSNTSILLIHITIIGGCSLLLAEAGLFVGVRRSIATHRNCVNVWKIPPTSLSHHLDRPKLPIPINPQWMPRRRAFRCLLAVPQLYRQEC